MLRHNKGFRLDHISETKRGHRMHDSNSHEKKNLETYYFDNLLKNLVNFSKKIFRYLLNMDVEKKKAVSLTLIIMTLCFFLGARDVFLFNHILCISYDYIEIDGGMINLDGYIVNYIIFLIMWSPAIYLLSLYWNRKTPKFHLSPPCVRIVVASN